MSARDRARLAAVIAALGALAGGSAAPFGCGGGHGSDDASTGSDAATTPLPPTLGAQIDRAGRPGITDALIAAFAASGADPSAQKAAYNQAPDPATWKTIPVRAGVTIDDEIKANVAVFDAIDNGLVQNAKTLPGCGNALGYIGPPSATTYRAAADLFADDQLYVDSSKPTCAVYFALELEQTKGGSFVHSTCGGRTLTHDALGVLTSVLAAGLDDGLDPANGFAPRIHASITAHVDVSDTFPFLGPPH